MLADTPGDRAESFVVVNWVRLVAVDFPFAAWPDLAPSFTPRPWSDDEIKLFIRFSDPSGSTETGPRTH